MNTLEDTIKQLSALSQETRLLVFKALMEANPDGMQAGAIAQHLEIAPNKLSTHLTILVNSGLISVERLGRRMIYRAEIDTVNEMLSSLVETCCHGHPQVCQPLSELYSQAC